MNNQTLTKAIVILLRDAIEPVTITTVEKMAALVTASDWGDESWGDADGKARAARHRLAMAMFGGGSLHEARAAFIQAAGSAGHNVLSH